MKYKNVEILAVGYEVLCGDVPNTNAAYISKGLGKLGYSVVNHTVVGDEPSALKRCLEVAFSRCDLVIMTGGLGPTYDDLTKETVAEYFSLPMEENEECRRVLIERMSRFGSITPNNYKQAFMPKGATVLTNAYGSAPGCIVEQGGKACILMPGPPREMKPMFDGQVIDFLADEIDRVIVGRTINLFGVGESSVEDRLKDIMKADENVTVAPYAKQSELQLKVTALGSSEEECEALIKPAVDIIEREYGNNIYGYGYSSIHDGAVDILRKSGLTVATAESCTGGMLSSRLTEISGSSEVFLGGVVAYSNAVKVRQLGVSEQTLAEHGAVSREVALEMARGARSVIGSDIGVGITGVAGPGGGSEKKPVGLVYVAVVSDTAEDVRELHLSRDREDDREIIRYSASSNALDMVIKQCKGSKQ